MNRKKIAAFILGTAIATSSVTCLSIYAYNTLNSNAVVMHNETSDPRKLLLNESAKSISDVKLDMNKASNYVVSLSSKDKDEKLAMNDITKGISNLLASNSLKSYYLYKVSDNSIGILVNASNSTEQAKIKTALNSIPSNLKNFVTNKTNRSLYNTAISVNSAASKIQNIDKLQNLDDAAKFYLDAGNKNYAEVTKMGSSNIIPMLDLSKIDTSKISYMYCTVKKDNGASGSTIDNYVFTGLKSATYSLAPMIAEKSITINYYLVDSNGNICKEFNQYIGKTSLAPAVKITDISFNLTSKSPELNIKVLSKDNSKLLTTPVIFYNGANNKAIKYSCEEGYNPQNTTYTNTHNITLPISSSEFKNVDIYLSDDAYNITKVSLDKSCLVNFDNAQDGKLILGYNRKISCNPAESAIISNFKFNNIPITLTNGKYQSTVAKDGAIIADYVYKYNTSDQGINVKYYINTVIDSSSPSLALKADSKNEIADNDRIFVNGDHFKFAGNYSDNYLKDKVKIEITNTSAGKNTSVKFNKGSDKGSFGTEVPLYQGDAGNNIKVTATDASGNITTKNFNVTVDKSAPIITSCNIDSNKLYHKDSFTPAITADDKDLDLSNSYFQIEDTDTKQITTYYFNNSSEVTVNNNHYSLAKAIVTEGIYNLTIHLQDTAGNKSEQTSSFYLYKKPVVSFNVSDKGYYVPFIPYITVSDKFIDENTFKSNPYDPYETPKLYALVDGIYSMFTLSNVTHGSDGINTLTFRGSSLITNDAVRGTHKIETTVFNNIQLLANDKITADSVNFSIDSISPTIQIDENLDEEDNDSDCYTGTIRPVIRFSDDHGISQATVTVNGFDIVMNNLNDMEDGDTKYFPDSSTYSLYGGKLTKKGNLYTFQFNDLTADGNYYISATARDTSLGFDENGNAGQYGNYGNENPMVSGKPFYLDNSAPVISLDGLEQNKFYQQVNAKITVSDPNYVASSTKLQLDGKDLDLSPISITKTSATYNLLLDDDGKHDLNITSTDKTGRNTCNKDIIFTIDKALPEINNVNITNKFYRTLNDKAPEGDLNQAPYVDLTESNLDLDKSYFKLEKVDSAGNHYDINTYYFSNSDKVIKIGERYYLRNAIDSDGNYYLTVHLCDLAGNETSTDLNNPNIDKKYKDYVVNFYVDRDVPNPQFTNAQSDYYNKGFNPIITFKDAFLDKTDLGTLMNAKLYKIQQDGKEVLVNNYKWSFSKASDDTITLTGGFLDDTNKGGTKYKLQFSVLDKGGKYANEKPVTISKDFCIDKVAPKIKEINIKDGLYYRTSFNPEVSIEENYINELKSYFSVTDQDGNETKYYFKYADSVSEGDCKVSFKDGKYVLNDVIKDDGRYTVEVYVEDCAGNTLASKEIKTMYLDQHVAKASIALECENDNEDMVYPNSSVPSKIGNYVTPVISIEDQFLSENDVKNSKYLKATLNDKAIDIVDVSKGDGLITIRLSPIERDTLSGTIDKLKILVRDKAAVDGEKEEDYNETTGNFIIDTTAPVIKFLGYKDRSIKDNGYYNGKMIPLFQISDNYAAPSVGFTSNNKTYHAAKISNSADGKGYIYAGDPITSDGAYSISASAVDIAGNTAAQSVSFIVDNTAPNIDISGVGENEFNNKPSTTVNIKVTDTNYNGSVHFSLTRNGVSTNISPNKLDDGVYSFSVSNEGEYKLTVTAEDKAGNVTTSPVRTFTIDRTAPALKFNVTNGQYVNKAFKPIISTDDPNDIITDVQIDGEAQSPNSLPTFVTDKEYELKARARDKAGNVSDWSTIKFTLDTTAPAVSVKGLENVFFNRDVKPVITYSDKNIEGISILLNGKNYDGQAISNEGNYSLVVSVSDKAKNVTEKKIDFTIDKTKPQITLGGSLGTAEFKNIYNTIVKPIIEVNDPNTMRVMLLDGEDYHGEDITKEGKHTLVIRVIDKAGNIAEKLLSFFIDTTAPKLSINGVKNGESYITSIKPAIQYEDGSSLQVTLNGKAFKLGDSVVNIGDYELVAVAKDQAGNETKQVIKFSIVKESLFTKTFVKHPLISGLLSSIAVILAGFLSIFFFKKKSDKPKKLGM